ncbi:MAG: Tyrosine recombinase XerC [Synergistetes bacterium ADurb.BinA166]|jgi:integrase/recombinase XerC|nr:MAG: Tyrosine recombinase XerC [Synergistetes bacterium ADurb.BinA166]
MLENIWSSIDIYLDHLRFARESSPHTVANYAIDLAQFAEFLGLQGVERPTDVDARVIRSFLREMVGFGYSKATASRKLSAVKSWSAFLRAGGNIEFDHAKGVKGPKLSRSLPRALSREDAARLVEEGPEGDRACRDRAMLELLYGCGLRVAELAPLKWEDMAPLEDRMLRVEGKGEKERLVPFGRCALEALDAWRSVEPPRSPYIFPGSRGGHVTVRTIHRVVTAAAARVGLSDVTPHTLRHSFATHLLEGGASIAVVRELLGHESMLTTQRYLAVSGEHLRVSYQAAHPRAKGEDEHV